MKKQCIKLIYLPLRPPPRKYVKGTKKIKLQCFVEDVTQFPWATDFKCQKCNFRTIFKDLLEHHESVAHRKRANKELAMTADLVIHQKAKHGIDLRKYKCSMCDFRTHTLCDLAKHKLTTHKGIFTCDLCTFSCISQEKLLLHKEKQHKMTLFECKECLLKFKFMSDLKLHTKMQHGVYAVKLECSECNHNAIKLKHSECDHKSNIKDPLEVKRECVPEEEIKSKDTLKMDLPETNEILDKSLTYGKNLCNLCSNWFESSKLITHKINVHGIKCFECSQCDFKTIYKQSLEMHVQRVHENQSIFNCKLCSLSFKSGHTLKIHNQDEHGMTIEIFHCVRCSFTTKYKRNLRLHEKAVHKKRPILNCKMCPAQFKSKTNQMSHMEEAHGQVSKSFQCPQCAYKTIYMRNVATHIKRVHTFSHTCSICSAEFKCFDKLMLHKKEHRSGIEYFECAYCEYKSKMRYHVKTHIAAVHENKPTVNCPLCPMKFRSRHST